MEISTTRYRRPRPSLRRRGIFDGLAKGEDDGRNTGQATRSEKRAASLGLHSFRHTNATAMDSPGIPQQIRKQRLGHSGNGVTERKLHTHSRKTNMSGKTWRGFWYRLARKGRRKAVVFPKSFKCRHGLLD